MKQFILGWKGKIILIIYILILWQILYVNMESYNWNKSEKLTEISDLNMNLNRLEDDEGMLYFFWSAYKNGDWDIYMKNLFNGKWSEEQNLTKSKDTIDFLPFGIKVGRGIGLLYFSRPYTGVIIWTQPEERKILFKTFNDSTWSEARDISIDNSFFSILRPNDKEIWLININSKKDNIVSTYIIFDGKNWSTEEKFVNDSVAFPSSLATDKEIWIFYYSPFYPPAYYSVEYDGIKWKEKMKLSSRQLFFDFNQISAIESKEKNIWILGSGSEDDKYAIFLRIFNEKWSDPEAIVTSDKRIKSLHLLKTKDDRIWLFWEKLDKDSKKEIYYKIFDGKNWSEDYSFSVQEDIGEFVDVLQTKDGIIWLFFNKVIEGESSQYYFITMKLNPTKEWIKMNRIVILAFLAISFIMIFIFFIKKRISI